MMRPFLLRPSLIAAGLAFAAAAFAASGQTPPSPDTSDATTASEAAAPVTDSSNASQAVVEPAAAASVVVPVTGDIERGRDLTFTCMGCHGITGYENAYPTFHVPLIGGQSEQYLISALTEYRLGERSHPTMQAQASGLSEQQIADIAAFLSSLKN